MPKLDLGHVDPLVAVSVLAGVPLADGAVHVPMSLSVGDRAEMVLERVKERTAHAAQGWEPERTRSVELVDVSERLPDGGFLLRVTTLESSAEGGHPAARAIRQALAASSVGLAAGFEVTARGSPVRVRDWRDLAASLLAHLRAAVREGGLGPEAAEAAIGMVEGMYGGLDDAGAAAAFGEVLSLWSACHGFRFETGGTYTGWSVEPALMTGTPVKTRYDLRLAGLDLAAGLARIEIRHTAPPASVAALVDGLMARAGKILGQPLPDEDRSEFNACVGELDPDLQITQTFEVGLDDGWTRSATDERRSKLGGEGWSRHLTRLTVCRLPRAAGATPGVDETSESADPLAGVRSPVAA